MTIIRRIVDHIDEEICGAKDYAEKYVEAKSEGNSMWANRYKEMTNDELKHATYLHDLAIEKIAQLRQVYEPTADMEEMWDKSHKNYVERVAWIKTMLNM